MGPLDIFSEEFARAAAAAGFRARQEALAEGHPVVFIDRLGRMVQEFPDGTKYEVRLDPAQPRESHVHVLRELPADQ